MKDRTDTAIEDEVDAIRLQIYEEVKDMTPEKFVVYSILRPNLL